MHHRDHMMTQVRLLFLAWLATLETINKLTEAEVYVNKHELTSLRLLGDQKSTFLILCHVYLE